jgi:hypothetical protein
MSSQGVTYVLRTPKTKKSKSKKSSKKCGSGKVRVKAHRSSSGKRIPSICRKKGRKSGKKSSKKSSKKDESAKGMWAKLLRAAAKKPAVAKQMDTPHASEPGTFASMNATPSAPFDSINSNMLGMLPEEWSHSGACGDEEEEEDAEEDAYDDEGDGN